MTEIVTRETLYNVETKLPTLSIIMVSYNQGSNIEQAILSVINQDYPYLEFIIIDGGSTDNTREIIDKYSSYIDLVISETDEGMYHARNKGIFLARGEYIGFLNTDDIFYPNALKDIGLKILENKNVDMIFGFTIGVNKYGEKMPRVLFGPNIDTNKAKYFKTMKTIPDQSTFYKRTVFPIIGIYDTSLKFGADTDLKCRIIKKGLSIIAFEKIIAAWRIYDEALTFRADLKNIRFKEAIKINNRYTQTLINYYNVRLLLYTYFVPLIKKILKYEKQNSL